jgi:4-hydroxy-4-methyl-2-oxoglutarate aldolase
MNIHPVDLVEYIKKNRISSTEFADALGKKGVIPNLEPTLLGSYAAGEVFLVYGCNNSNYTIHKQISTNSDLRGKVILIANFDSDPNRACIGDLVCKYLCLYRGAQAVVVLGKVRDLQELRKQKWPVWSQGASPLGFINEPARHPDPEWISDIRKRFEGAIAVCDDTGVAISFPEQKLDVLLQRVESLEKQEDDWYFRLDRNKESTFDIVCGEFNN